MTWAEMPQFLAISRLKEMGIYIQRLEPSRTAAQQSELSESIQEGAQA